VRKYIILIKITKNNEKYDIKTYNNVNEVFCIEIEKEEIR